MDNDYTIIEIEWSEASGHVKNAGSPYLFGWLHALYVRQWIADGRALIVARDPRSRTWSEYFGNVTASDAESLMRAIDKLGIPQRVPEVESVPDTSDTWFASRVSIAIGEKTQRFVVSTQRLSGTRRGGFAGTVPEPCSRWPAMTVTTRYSHVRRITEARPLNRNG